MRTRALLLLALSLVPSSALADPTHEIVVARAAVTPGTATAGSLTDRLQALGLTPRMSLLDGLPLNLAPPDPADPFGLDPERVILVEARDSSAAAAALEALARDPRVAWAEPNQPRAPAGFAPDDPLFVATRQWGLWNAGSAGVFGGTLGADIHASDAWAISTGSNDILLAIADTGIDATHPDLGGTRADGTPRIAFGLNTGEAGQASFADSVGHGTAVAAVMAARTNDGAHFDSLGMAGVCGGDGGANLGCRLVPIKVTDGHVQGASSFAIARAILYATSLGARAINVSYAGGGASRLERLAMLVAVRRGCVVVAAAGNEGWRSTAPQYPAAYARDGLGIAVGASDARDRSAVWSSYGPWLDLLAPGEDIWSAWPTYPVFGNPRYPGYLLASGTSFAAPFVTGTIGLLAAARPDLQDVDLQHVVRESAFDLAIPGRDDETGHGRLDAAAALAAVGPEVAVWHDEIAAQSLASAGVDTLVLAEFPAGLGNLSLAPRRALAERLEVTATVALPDSFLDGARVWARVGGTSTMRGEFRTPYATPWAEADTVRGRTFTLRGDAFRLVGEGAASGLELPVPLDQARFGFTVLGRVRRQPAPAEPEAAFDRATPNPFHAAITVRLPGATEVEVFDVTGRWVRRLRLHEGRATWDGRDARGARVRPGLYLARARIGSATRTLHLVRLE